MVKKNKEKLVLSKCPQNKEAYLIAIKAERKQSKKLWQIMG
jgi:hypothetical protein